MRHIVIAAAASALLALGGINAAHADECSGRSHDTGTALGAVGGAAIGGLASHSVVGAIAGAVVGGVAGNAIARGEDCDHRAAVDRDGQRQAYVAGRADQADRDDVRADADGQQAYEAGRADQADRDADRAANAGKYPN